MVRTLTAQASSIKASRVVSHRSTITQTAGRTELLNRWPQKDKHQAVIRNPILPVQGCVPSRKVAIHFINSLNVAILISKSLLPKSCLALHYKQKEILNVSLIIAYLCAPS